ncbi:hypothetical protein BDK51DRAFT_47662 [Blyttiomyces helicus]|uniref:Uncharacterized protein n=1 Tax=Blyttiomyces helicus TaxID=388810 RepID=A0A4P9W6I2_9FUNG|nr:hypothetical protein BDK51DRAFT_47662 [Blyttiomyces helicus]|eukprot:RKO85736.1 hypothetical protein BDK51DRAFT_47662 [Blyttiomyces helicus]
MVSAAVVFGAKAHQLLATSREAVQRLQHAPHRCHVSSYQMQRSEMVPIVLTAVALASATTGASKGSAGTPPGEGPMPLSTSGMRGGFAFAGPLFGRSCPSRLRTKRFSWTDPSLSRPGVFLRDFGRAGFDEYVVSQVRDIGGDAAARSGFEAAAALWNMRYAAPEALEGRRAGGDSLLVGAAKVLNGLGRCRVRFQRGLAVEEGLDDGLAPVDLDVVKGCHLGDALRSFAVFSVRQDVVEDSGLEHLRQPHVRCKNRGAGEGRERLGFLFLHFSLLLIQIRALVVAFAVRADRDGTSFGLLGPELVCRDVSGGRSRGSGEPPRCLRLPPQRRGDGRNGEAFGSRVDEDPVDVIFLRSGEAIGSSPGSDGLRGAFEGLPSGSLYRGEFLA